MTIIDVYYPFIEIFNQVGMNESFLDKKHVEYSLFYHIEKNIEFKFDLLNEKYQLISRSYYYVEYSIFFHNP